MSVSMGLCNVIKDKSKNEVLIKNFDSCEIEILDKLTKKEIEEIINYNPTNIDYDNLVFENF